MVSISGEDRPCSHDAMVVFFELSRSANSVWVNPKSFLLVMILRRIVSLIVVSLFFTSITPFLIRILAFNTCVFNRYYRHSLKIFYKYENLVLTVQKIRTTIGNMEELNIRTKAERGYNIW